MVENWFIDDVQAVLAKHRCIVITDANGDGEYLLKSLPPEVKQIMVTDEWSEIEAKYFAETRYKNNKVAFYSKRKADGLGFLQEYVQTSGVLVLDDMESYIRRKLFDATGKNTSISGDKLLLAAKLSKGKDIKWWCSIADGIAEPLDLEDWLLDFLHSPDETKSRMDETVWNVFRSEVYNAIGSTPIEQPADVLAREVANVILNGLVSNSISPLLERTYYRWADSAEKYDSLRGYIDTYVLNASDDALNAHQNHPFSVLDKRVMILLSDALKKTGNISAYVSYFQRRLQNKKAKMFKPEWLRSTTTLCSFRSPDLTAIRNYPALAECYMAHYSKLDTAMRKLYVAWLNDEKTLRPLQEYYSNLCKGLYEKWFSIEENYTPTQKGLIGDLFADGKKTAVIVCDGLRLEIADCVVDGYDKSGVKVNKKTAFAVLPSVTENGMSALFGCEEPTTSAQVRFDTLREVYNDVNIIQLDKLNDGTTSNRLVLLYGDIDQTGEKKQMGALKDIDNYESELRECIKLLFKLGYQKVVLTADHGFVITGILDEADKEPRPSSYVAKVEERYVLCEDPLYDDDLIECEGSYLGSSYQYYAKTDKPFRTRGAYGYSHGGFTPQECIIPAYELSSDNADLSLAISISNKNDLKEIVGEFFTVKLKAAGGDADLFNQERKVKLMLFSRDVLSGTTTCTMKPGNEFQVEFELAGLDKLVVADAVSGVQLDSCVLGKSVSRDLDGLF